MSAHFHASLKVPASSNSSIGTVPARQGWLALTLAVPSRLWREVQLRRATRNLEGMDDRMLGDIGIGRADIEVVVRNGRHVLPYL